MLTGPLAERFRVIAVDNRGTGRSAKPPGPYSIEQMAADVVGLTGRLHLRSAHLAGISLGGRIAMAFALDCPERVDRLVLIATSPRAAGRRWLVPAGMMMADLPMLRGRHRQPRHAIRAQFEATTRFDCTSRLGHITHPADRARQVRPHRPGRAGRADDRIDPALSARPDRRRAPGAAADPAPAARIRDRRVPRRGLGWHMRAVWASNHLWAAAQSVPLSRGV